MDPLQQASTYHDCTSATGVGAPARAALAGLALLVAVSAEAAAPAPIKFQYDLATSAGKITTTGAGLVFDARSREVLVLENGLVRVFNEVGIEVHTFGAEAELQGVRDIAPLDAESGDYLVLAMTPEGRDDLVRCDFRGTPLGRLEIKGIPEEIASVFRPSVLGYFDGKIYLGDAGSARVVTVDVDGNYVSSIDLAPMLKSDDPADEKGLVEATIRGLRVDARGNILFTVPTLFRAFVVTPDGKVRSWGKRGSTPGKFNVVMGVASDEQGNFYVMDILRCVVSVFNADLQYVSQFGGRGRGAGRLITPASIVYGDGRVFVSQGLKRGVSVFKPIEVAP